jgi:DNA-binding response OmpR family regulator
MEHPTALRGSETILLADDDQLVRRWLHKVLQDLGYTIILARDGAEAVEAFSANRDTIDAVILDVVMPKLPGPKAYEMMVQAGLDVPALFITGYGFDAIPSVSQESSGPPVLYKPFADDELARRVRELLDERDTEPVAPE